MGIADLLEEGLQFLLVQLILNKRKFFEIKIKPQMRKYFINTKPYFVIECFLKMSDHKNFPGVLINTSLFPKRFCFIFSEWS